MQEQLKQGINTKMAQMNHRVREGVCDYLGLSASRHNWMSLLFHAQNKIFLLSISDRRWKHLIIMI